MFMKCNETPTTILHNAIAIQKVRYEVKNTKKWSGGRLNKKDGLTRYGYSHVKDKTS